MRLASALLDLIFPGDCGGCGAAVDGGGVNLCWDCHARLILVEPPYCARCGDPVDGLVESDFTCSACRRAEPAFTLARSAARYRGPLCAMLQRFKYAGRAHLAADLARLALACARTHYAAVRFDAVACVPLYRSRERLRTYNQSRLLAAALGRELDLPLAPRGTILRRRDTATQTGLNARERRSNVADAFTVGLPEWVEGRTLLLVDDVMTTGATVDACARALREAQAAGVYVVTVARG